ncbi:hypothetical protein LSM04_004322 [Trypanosoma melophagium]|uniref:uncharacterized protein n=1 Tax=Trypanosoma melophagium TaxID=715481 RepID=UPI003519F171|nr:hypothetical protein LSM04_004322 [Trypanosoma melophagium]
MIDITSVSTRVLATPFSLLTVDSVLSNDTCEEKFFLLFVGNDRACVASFQEGKPFLCKFVPQFHRTLTTGACCTMSLNDANVFVLGDSASTVTLHYINQLTHNTSSTDSRSSTIFIGNAWDVSTRINHIVPVRGCSGVDAVCTRSGELGTVWRMSFEREEANILKVDGSLGRLFSHNNKLSGCFMGATSGGVSLISPETGCTVLEFKLPYEKQFPEAVQASRGGDSLFAVMTSCGVAHVYDQRRAEKPIWSKSLRDSPINFGSSDSSKGESNNNNINDFDNTSIITSCSAGVWAIYSNKALYFLRCIDESVVCRSFPYSESFLPPNITAAGLCFTNNILHILGSKGED